MRILLILLMLCSQAWGQEVVTKLDVVGQNIINEELRRTRSSTSANGASIVAIQADLASKFTSGVLNVANGGTGQDTAQEAIDALLPSQTGNSGKFLTTNGTNAGWDEIANTFTNDASTLIANSASEQSKADSGYTKLKEITFNGNGALQVSFEGKMSSVGHGAQLKVYKNGSAVSSAFEMNGSVTYTVYTYDITGLVAGDAIQIYGQADAGYTVYVRNFKLYGTTQTIGM